MNFFSNRCLAMFVLLTGSMAVAQQAKAQWVQIENPATAHAFNAVDFARGQSEVGFIAASTGTYRAQGQILRTEDNGLTWQVVWESTDESTGVVSLSMLSATEIYAGLQSGELLKSTDGGDTWKPTVLTTDETGDLTTVQFYDQNNGVACTQYAGCFYTSDAGATWTQSVTNVVGITADVEFINESTVLAVGSGESMFRSTDGGANWALVAIDTGTQEPLTFTAIDFADENHGIAVSYSGAAFYTEDGGNSWISMDYPMPFGHLQFALAVNPTTFYAGGGNSPHIFMTEDAGETWISAQYPFELIQDDAFPTDMAMCANGIAILIGVHYTILRTDTGNSVEEIAFASLNTYPNPAQDQLNLTVEVLREGMYVFSLYNELGQELMNKQVQVNGPKNLSFNVANFPSGSYILSISNANNKMLHQEKVQIMR